MRPMNGHKRTIKVAVTQALTFNSNAKAWLGIGTSFSDFPSYGASVAVDGARLLRDERRVS
jgi:hypothetical protein